MYKEIEPNSERWFDFNLLENEIWRDIKGYVYDKNTNKLLYTFKSRREAQKELKVTHIGEYINGIRKNNKKYIFKEEKYDI